MTSPRSEHVGDNIDSESHIVDIDSDIEEIIAGAVRGKEPVLFQIEKNEPDVVSIDMNGNGKSIFYF